MGAINWDVTIFVESLAQKGEEVPVLRVEEFPGGKGANAAVAAARILGKRKVSFIGALGNDQYEGPLTSSLEAEGVTTDGLAVLAGMISGRAFIAVDGTGSKAIHTFFGANDALRPSHLAAPGAREALASASTVVIMDVPLRVAYAAASAARRSKARVFYCPGVRSTEDPRQLARAMRLADFVVLNRSELANVTGCREPAEGLRVFRRRFPSLAVVVTLGTKGCAVSAGPRTSTVPPVDLADLGLRPVNSTGSGDAFLAAFACYSMLGMGPTEAASWGNLAGALKSASPLTRGSPTRRYLESSMSALRNLRGRPRG
jgi:ribokinase